MDGRCFRNRKHRMIKVSCDDFGNLGYEALPKSVAALHRSISMLKCVYIKIYVIWKRHTD